MPIFQNYELSDEYQLFTSRLPTINDGLKYILSRKTSMPDRNARVREFSKKTYELWEKADCCPLSLRRICTLADDAYDKYVSFLKKSGSSNIENEFLLLHLLDQHGEVAEQWLHKLHLRLCQQQSQQQRANHRLHHPHYPLGITRQ